MVGSITLFPGACIEGQPKERRIFEFTIECMKAQCTFDVFSSRSLVYDHTLARVEGADDISILKNKDKVKKGHLPEDMLSEKRYLAAQTVLDLWICYPWEAT